MTGSPVGPLQREPTPVRSGDTYYGNVNPDILREMRPHWRQVCEFGCGSGGLARAFKKLNPACRYVGVELSPQAAERAREVADAVLIRNLDQVPNWAEDTGMAEVLQPGSFDAVVFGDVLEHLQQPQAALRQAVELLVPGGLVLACIPNVQHWSVFANLLAGRWPQQDAGLFDRTHLRWFTLSDMIALLQGSGLTVISARPRHPVLNEHQASQRQRLVALLEPAAKAMGVTDMGMFANQTSALQFVLVGEKKQS